MLPLIILSSVAIAALGVALLMTRLFPRRLPPANRAELLDRIRRLK